MEETNQREKALIGGVEARVGQRRTRLLVGLLLVVVVVGACVPGRQLAGGDPAGGSSTIVDMAAGVVVNQLEEAEGLPLYEPSIQGIVDHVQDNSIFVRQLPPLDQIVEQMTVEFGPMIEVVVTGDTIVYEVLPSGPPVDGVIHEVVAAGSPKEIGESHLITVWGEKRGDRIVAVVLKYNTHTKIVLPSGPIN
ncbi:MAG: hypothetical protein GTO14_05120 [Anaerolineales bacterium]|nr:hypothetical protein [Anaerolineales bacterium]